MSSFTSKEAYYSIPNIANLHERYTPTSREEIDSTPTDVFVSSPKAIRLGRGSEHTPWIEALPYSQDSYEGLELNILNPINVWLGHTALVDSVILLPGDTYQIGRIKYPTIDRATSRRHALFSASDGSILRIRDLGSANGTYIFNRRDDGPEPDHLHDENEDSDPNQSKNNDAANDDELDKFISKYTVDFPNLSVSDLQLCLNICNDLRGRFDMTKEKLKVERLLNIRLHPDRKITPNEKINHELYLLGKRVLNL